jgi:murein DD-endopeptidase MepM/ murein hydrolase activator NlpD
LRQRLLIGKIIAIVFLLIFPPLFAGAEPPVVVIRQGEVLLFAVPVSPDVFEVTGLFQNKLISFSKKSSQSIYGALIGIDLAQSPGEYPLEVTLHGTVGEEHQKYTVEVRPREFGIQKLTLPKDKVDLDEKTAQRVNRDAEQFKTTFEESADQRGWQSAFRVPVEGKIAKTFGQRRIINGQDKNPHTGEDISAPLGAEVIASNNGRVVLVGDFFFNGLSIVIDHGEGLFTMYFHLSEVRVTAGAFVKRGEVIGLVGQSGRATGPHLHWGARLRDARVDPFSLVKTTLEETAR